MKVINARLLRGPNLSAASWPCVKALIDLEDLHGVSSAELPGFTQRLCTLMPSLGGRSCPEALSGDFGQYLRNGVPMARVVEQVLLELQCLAGTKVSFGHTQISSVMPHCHQLICAYQLESVVGPALEASVALVEAAAHGESPDLEAVLVPLRRLAERDGMGHGMHSILDAALARGIPSMRFAHDPSLFQLGLGARQQRIHAILPHPTCAPDPLLGDGQPSKQASLNWMPAPPVASIDTKYRYLRSTPADPSCDMVEFYAAPVLRIDEFLDGAPPIDAEAIIAALFPTGDDGRIPVVAVTGTNGKTTTTLLIASAFRAAGYKTGVATTEGVFIGAERVDKDDCTGYWSARTVLSSPLIEVAVLETARGGILKRGLGFDRCEVAVILNVTADHLGQDGIDTIEDLARVKGLIAKVAYRAVVLNAEDEHCVGMASQAAPGVEILYFSCDENNNVLQAHLKQGGRAVYLSNGEVVLAGPDKRGVFFQSDSLDVTLHGCARHNSANTLAAVAALVAQGCPTEAIIQGIRQFSCNTRLNPLRLNLFKAGAVTVLLDYAHNPAAYRALLSTARAIGCRRVVGVVTAPGDRRDVDLQQIARICAEKLDAMVVYETDEFRGRKPGETSRILLESGLAAARGRIPVKLSSGALRAICDAYAYCRAGDLLLIGGATQLKHLEQALAQVLPAASHLVEESS